MSGLPNIAVCSVSDLESLLKDPPTHLVSIWDPVWLERDHQNQIRELAGSAEVHFVYFNDVIGPKENKKEPTEEDIRGILSFASKLADESSVLIHCWAGISRSTAVAYAILCQAAGPSRERECLEHLRSLRPTAVPNARIVELADKILERGGRMNAVLGE